uniref:Uncharacterized protein n=1 Tax=viral metagenome TaxID=1070528 RepID=A0A6M3LFY7_9ZZZZ
MKDIRVISGEKDGADLRREKAKQKYCATCTGTADNQQIEDALDFTGKGETWVLPEGAWNRIFANDRGMK